MSKQSVLIIEDSKPINNSLRRSLESRNFNVTQVFNIAQAKDVLLKKEFEYALLDLILPDGNGEDLLPFLQIYEKIKVIVMTSDRDKDRREHLFSYGIVIDYIIKERHFHDMELEIVQLIQRISTNFSLTILIVDDSSFMRNHLRILLSKRGFQVVDAINGKDALEKMSKFKIDAAMVDLEMPVMDGNSLVNAIRQDKINLLMPIMVLSGTTEPEKIARVIKNGANDFLKKPYVTEELLLKIDKMMQDLKNQRQLREQEVRFGLYNKAIDEAAIFFKLDHNLKITYSNKALCDVIADCISIKNKSNFPSYVDKTSLNSLEELNKAINNFKSYQNIFSLKSEHFKDVKIRLTFTPLFDSNKKVYEIIVIGFDVSLLYKKEEILQERVEREIKRNLNQNRMLIQQSKMASMGEMIGHIGHQWRQPLNSLGLIFQKLNRAHKKKVLNNELMEQSTQKAISIIDQMSKTINDFRDFFKSDKQWQNTKLSVVTEQACNIIEPALQENRIKLTVNEKSDITVPCFKNELSQVIMNILANSMDAIVLKKMKDGEIIITFGHNEKSAYIIIDDNAGGIPEDIIEKIFKPYFTTKEEDNGTGIGLYMSKEIIEGHMNGKLEVVNTISGASFKIFLPLKQENEIKSL